MLIILTQILFRNDKVLSTIVYKITTILKNVLNYSLDYCNSTISLETTK